MITLKSLATTAAIGWACVGVAATAQDTAAPAEAPPAVAITGTAAFVTDYRFRGVSLSDRDVAGQASIVATSQFGLFASIWGSTIEPIGAYTSSNGDFHNGSEQEIDLTVGYSKAFGAITPTVGVLYYVYPGGKNVAYVEPFASIAGTVGPVGLTFGGNYVPKQDNTGDNDNLYLYLLGTYGITNTPITLRASVGREKGAFDYGSSSKIDYMAGVDFKYRMLTLSLQYIGNDLDRAVTGGKGTTLYHNAKDGVVVSLTAAF